MDNVRRLVGSVSDEDFILGLLMESRTNTLGEIWEKCVNCNNCKFAKQCAEICSTFEDKEPTKNPTCRDVVSLLLGEIKVEDIK